jgi:hypothetical protein
MMNMLSAKLVRLIETHGDEISDRIVTRIRHDPELSHLAKLTHNELQGRAAEILNKLGHWLTQKSEEEFAARYEAVGKLRFGQAIPLHEAVRALHMIKERIFSFLDEQGLDHDCLTLYAEEQLGRHVGRFFDLLVFHLVCGYEDAWRHATRAAHSA